MKCTVKRNIQKRRSASKLSCAQSALEKPPRLPNDYPWRVLAAFVEDVGGYLQDTDKSELLTIIRSRSFERIQSLAASWGLQSMCLSDGSKIFEQIIKLQASCLIRKFTSPSLEDEDRRVSFAMEKFHAADRACAVFNDSLESIWKPDGQPHKWLVSLRNDIGYLLGDADPESSVEGRHGPGADTATSGRRCSSYDKYAEWPYSVTPAARTLAQQLIESDERWFGALEHSYRVDSDIPMYEILDWEMFWASVLREEVGNRITTVPKDWSEDRPIAIEPRMNMFLQLAVDGTFKRCLRQVWNIDLRDQTRNQQLAYAGSVSDDADSCVTVDLSSASDSISIKLVELLFSADWFEVLMKLRSPQGELPGGGTLQYAKISSMGCGFTFALESIVFAAIARLAVRLTSEKADYSKVSVYGDDIIVPKYASDALLCILKLLGFTPNIRKTFLSGKVRESCGADWWNGINVRPIYLKRLPETWSDLFTHRNLIFRWATRHLGCELPSLDALFLHWIPQPLRLTGPCSDEDFGSYLHSSKAPLGAYRQFAYRFIGIAERPLIRKAKCFEFRKLMAPLRVGPTTMEPMMPWERKPCGSGSIFDVVRTNSRTYTLSAKRCSIEWSDEYTSVIGLGAHLAWIARETPHRD